MSDSVKTIRTLLDAGTADHPAISSPRGIAPNDRVAFVLDNGPEAATTFLSIAAGATAAPLNPAYRADEFEFYLSDLNAKILIVAHDKPTPAIEVADKLGIPIVHLTPTPEQGSGSFTLAFPDMLKAAPAQQIGAAASD